MVGGPTHGLPHTQGGVGDSVQACESGSWAQGSRTAASGPSTIAPADAISAGHHPPHCPPPTPPASAYLWPPQRLSPARLSHCASAAGPAAGGGRGPAPGRGQLSAAQPPAPACPGGPAASPRAAPGSTRRPPAAGPTAGSCRPAWRQGARGRVHLARAAAAASSLQSSLSRLRSPVPKVPSLLASPRASRRQLPAQP